MSLPREQKKSQPPWLDLAIFACVLAFLFYSIFNLRGYRAPIQTQVKPQLELAEQALPEPVRQPASELHEETGSTEVLRLRCSEPSSKQIHSSAARLLKLHLSECGRTVDASTEWKASNRTSGEEIIVFENEKEETLSTSYFALKEGINEISLMRDDGHGRIREESLKIKH